MRLIDADTLDCLAWKDGEHGTTFDDGVLWVLSKIDEQPTIEPQIVRCNDCLMHGVCRFEQGLGVDGYCSQAERRTDDRC